MQGNDAVVPRNALLQKVLPADSIPVQLLSSHGIRCGCIRPMKPASLRKSERHCPAHYNQHQGVADVVRQLRQEVTDDAFQLGRAYILVELRKRSEGTVARSRTGRYAKKADICYDVTLVRATEHEPDLCSVEVDGREHRHPANQKRDRKKDSKTMHKLVRVKV